MSVSQKARRGLMAAGAIGSLALGGATLANAATNGTAPADRPDPTTAGGHVGSNGKTEEALPASVAAKVKAAAEAELAGGTVQRVETDVDHGSPYEAHVVKADGTQVEVLVDEDFQVTAVNAMGPR